RTAAAGLDVVGSAGCCSAITGCTFFPLQGPSAGYTPDVNDDTPATTQPPAERERYIVQTITMPLIEHDNSRAKLVDSSTPTSITDARLHAWVQEMAALCQPDGIQWCDGSQQEYDQLCELLVQSGTFVCYIADTHDTGQFLLPLTRMPHAPQVEWWQA